MHFAQVILPLNLQGTFTYKVPDFLLGTVQIGMRVLVSFRGKKIYTAIVSELHDETPETFIPKEIINTLDDFPIVPAQQMAFWHWLSRYYLCNLGEIYRFSFPGSLKLESETYLKLKPNVKIDFENLDVNETYLMQAMEVRPLINLTEIEAFIPKKEIVKTINFLIGLQYIEIDEKIAEKYKAKEVAFVKIKNEEIVRANLPEILLQLKRSRKQQELLLLILEKQTENPDIPIRKSALLEEGSFASAQLKSLAEKDLVEEYLLNQDRLQAYNGEMEEIEELTDAQSVALYEVTDAFKKDENVLLHGVTSSGKTHIYLEKIEEAVNDGKNVLFLLPEIALTKQITQRLEKKYGKKLGFYHQKLSDFERVEIWKKIKNNELSIIIGTRNALFLPYENLGLVVVDEEHDSAYRPREVSPYFNAKDAAIILAKLYGAHVILGSATPSVESYYAAKKERLRYVFLGERFGGAKLPTYEIINFKEAQDSKKVVGNFSQYLLDQISKQISAKKQTIILHNRRGYSNVVECESCGYVNYCSNCDVVMTYHKSANEMKCHYCGQKASKPIFCPKCHSEKMNDRGIGVEQIQEELIKNFPEAEIDRMDVDSMRKKFAYERLYERIENGESDVIVGTQMISKGLDFDNIELVGIPRADQMIYVQDFRAEERAYQLITQVAGRAGRVSGEGRVLLQTYNPEHPIFQLIKENIPSKVYEHLLTERKKFNYPPFTRLIMIELKHRKEDKTERAARFLGSVLRKYLPEECIFGPEKSPVSRINLLYQYQILIKLPRGSKHAEYKNYVLKSFEEFNEITAYQSVRKEIYVDF